MTDAGSGDSEGIPIPDLIQSLPAAICAIGPERRVVWSNRAMQQLVPATPANGDDFPLRLFLSDGTPLPWEASPIATVLTQHQSDRSMEVLVEHPDGRRTPFILQAAPIRNGNGGFDGAIVMLLDIADRRESETNYRNLISQLIHREMNELQTIQSLLTGAQREAVHPEAKQVLADTIRRIAAVAAAQTAVTRTASGSFDPRLLLETLSQSAARSFGAGLDISFDASAGSLPNRVALPLAIIISELISNSVRHGRGDRNRVAVRVTFEIANSQAILMVQDDGPGFQPQPAKRRASGLGLVDGLVRQLGGSLEVTAHNGALCAIRFPS